MFKKIKIILSKKQMGSFYFFVLLSFISMILETLGIGLIIPFMQALVTDGINQHLANFLNFFSIYPTSKYNLIFILIAILASVYTLKVSFLTYVLTASNLRCENSESVQLSNKARNDVFRSFFFFTPSTKSRAQ